MTPPAPGTSVVPAATDVLPVNTAETLPGGQVLQRDPSGSYSVDFNDGFGATRIDALQAARLRALGGR